MVGMENKGNEPKPIVVVGLDRWLALAILNVDSMSKGLVVMAVEMTFDQGLRRIHRNAKE